MPDSYRVKPQVYTRGNGRGRKANPTLLKFKRSLENAKVGDAFSIPFKDVLKYYKTIQAGRSTFSSSATSEFRLHVKTRTVNETVYIEVIGYRPGHPKNQDFNL